MRMKRITSILALVLMLILLTGCGHGAVLPAQTPEGDSGVSRTVFAMDTVMELSPQGEHAKEACELGEARIHELESLLSVTIENSEIYAANHAQGRPVPLSPDVQTLLSDALYWCGETDGALDISIYPVLRTWGFTTGEYRVPEDAELEALLKNVDYTRVDLNRDSGTVTLPEGMEIDLGSVAKGYTGDVMMQVFRDAGVTSGMISLGGNVQVLGTKPGGTDWRIAVQDPNGDGFVGIVEVSDKAVITSGGYERFFEKDGVTYWHILDPETGKSAHSGVVSATVVGKSGTMCDALSTALFVMGPERASDFWKTHAGDAFDYILVLEDGSLVITEGVESRFTTVDSWANARIEVIRR